MKFKKTAKLLSTVLALAISACSLTGMAGVTSSAADSGTAVTTDYSTVGAVGRAYLNDYYTTLNMYDGMGVSVQDPSKQYGSDENKKDGDGLLAIDLDTRWDVSTRDNILNVTNPYAIYNIAENTEFTAVFSDTTDFSNVNVLVSRDMVSWTDAEPDISGKTLKIGTPNDISFVKIVLPTDNDRSAGIKSVTYTKAENAADVHRIDFSKSTDTGAVASNDIYKGSNTIQVTWKDTGSGYNPYLIYKVQPGTRFGLNVTEGNMNIDYKAIAAKLGYDNALDWTMEIYGSADNVNYELLPVSPVWSAGYTNGQTRTWSESNPHAARRRMDWNFIVPDGVTYIKVKFPLNKTLDSVYDTEGNKVYPYAGNDLFDINRVEYTELKYDYTKNTDMTLSNDTKDNFGIWSYGGGFKRRSDNGRFDADWSYQDSGKNDTNVVYRVKPGTAFYSCFYIGWEGGANNFRNQYGYAVKISGSDSPNGGWTDVATVFNDETYVAGKQYYAGIVTAEQNKYEFIKISWPGKTSSVTGNDLSQLEAVAFTANEEAYDEVVYDYTATAGQVFDNDTLSNYGMYAINDIIVHESDGSFDCDWASQRDRGHANTWISYNVKPGTAFYASFYNPWNLGSYAAVKDFVMRIQGSNGDGEWSDITSITVTKEDTIAVGNKYSAYVSAAQNNYKFIRVLWPEKASNDFVGEDTMRLSGVAFTPYSADAPTYKNGDVNGDDEVDLLDYVKLKKIIAGVDTTTGADPDLDGNGVANSADLTLLRKYLIGAIDTL